ncbi:MAG: uridine kinase [Oligoflexales bacterium]|nr:uridine kinase [Oligoflexales bacterium]
MNSSPLIVGVAGGSCSGKTTIVKAFHRALGRERCAVLYQDNYYFDRSREFDFDGGAVNFDHPEAIEFKLIAEHLSLLKAKKKVEVPLYDFLTHGRKNEKILFEPKSIIFLDGILILNDPEVRSCLDLKIFVECDHDIRLARRIQRDAVERGRSEQGIREQFIRQVAPMHEKYVQTSAKYADHILSQVDVDEVIKGNETKILSFLAKFLVETNY